MRLLTDLVAFGSSGSRDTWIILCILETFNSGYISTEEYVERNIADEQTQHVPDPYYLHTNEVANRTGSVWLFGVTRNSEYLVYFRNFRL